MIVFWILAALLVASALVFVLPPLLGGERRAARASRQSANLEVLRDQLRELEADLTAGGIDQKQYANAREDLERRVIEEAAESSEQGAVARPGCSAAAGGAVVLPMLAVASYLLLGNPDALDPARVVPAADAGAHELGAEQIQAMTERLARRLQEQPDDIEGWKMLARSYGALGRYDDAAAAYAAAAEKAPRDAQLLADYADVLAMAQGRRLAGEPERLIAQALQADPKNIKALALAGTVAFDRRDYAGAVAGVFQLDPRLRDKVAESDTVFIYAHAGDAGAIPLAMVRTQVKDLPARFVLDDRVAMLPGQSLSQFRQVSVGARISRSALPHQARAIWRAWRNSSPSVPGTPRFSSIRSGDEREAIAMDSWI